jgi:cytochrome d ubiquinol oxidase subunit I
MKLAALEGLYRTESGAPIHIGGVYVDDHVRFGVPLPKLLSIVARHDPDATIQGLEAVPAADRPPVNVVRFAFQTMVAIGTALAALGLGYVILWWRRGRLPRSRWFYRAVVAAGPLSVVALICGWITTEVGRQPWVVYRVLRTEDAVTHAGGLPYVFAGMVTVYLLLGSVAVVTLRRTLLRGPEPRAGAGT